MYEYIDGCTVTVLLKETWQQLTYQQQCPQTEFCHCRGVDGPPGSTPLARQTSTQCL